MERQRGVERKGTERMCEGVYVFATSLQLVLDWTLETGVARQMEAFREGFNSVFPISSLQMFYSHEVSF